MRCVYHCSTTPPGYRGTKLMPTLVKVSRPSSGARTSSYQPLLSHSPYNMPQRLVVCVSHSQFPFSHAVCSCNLQANNCTYNEVLQQGVCNCEQNTAGVACETCAEGFYQDQLLLLTDPNVCQCKDDGARSCIHSKSVNTACGPCPSSAAGLAFSFD